MAITEQVRIHEIRCLPTSLCSPSKSVTDRLTDGRTETPELWLTKIQSVRTKMRLSWLFCDNLEDILGQFGGHFDEFGTSGEVGEVV